MFGVGGLGLASLARLSGSGAASSPPEPVTTRLEAETATLGGTVSIDDFQAGFSGTGYADFGNDATDYIEWTVSITNAGTYDIAFGYANGDNNSDRSLLLEINGVEIERLDFAATNGWDDWQPQSATPAFLSAGSHTIRLQSDGGPGPNVDYLEITGPL